MTRELPSRRARSISSAAAPSTQPPLTEPAIRPSSARSRTAPSGRGAEPNVRTTTARPIPTPSRRQDSSVGSSSFIAAAALPWPGRGPGRPSLAAPRSRIVTPARAPASAEAAASPPRRTSLERTPARISPRRSRLATVPAGRKSSMYGIGRPHPAGERLVARRPGERVEPDEPVAVAAKARRLGRDERRIAAVPAVRHDDDDAARPQRPARPPQVELAERLADSRPARPVADRLGDAGEGAVPVAVAEQPRDAGELRPEHERLSLDRGRRRERLDEPQQQPRVALHRPGDVAQDDDLARPLHGPPPDPLGELAAGREVAPEHRPRGEQPAVVMELVAAGPAQLEARHEQVDEPLRVAQLGRRHPVEVAVAERFGRAVRIGCRDVAVDVGLVDRLVAARHRQRDAVDGALLAGARVVVVRATCPRLPRRPVALPRAAPRAADPPPAGACRAAATSDRRRGRRPRDRRGAGRRPRRPRRGPSRDGRDRRASAPARSRPRRPGRSTGRPAGARARTRRPRRAAVARRPRRRWATGRSRDRERGSSPSGQGRAAASAR